MAISEKLVKELKQILKEEYGKDLTQREAWEMGQTLVGYFGILIEMGGEQKSNKPQNTII